uniref:SKIP_SNW domain-containing protein n=1 Tax=Panagrellus redivivus TaxID=6233 RepID=A0A7E4ZQD9_PANRE
MSFKITDVLPAPSNIKDQWDSEVTRDSWFAGRNVSKPSTAVVSKVKQPPAYGQRRGFFPRSVEDFGDGGSFPEIHIAQHPLGMGKDAQRGAAASKTVALQYDEQGKLRFDALVKQGHGAGKIVHSRLADTKSKVIDETDETLQKPNEDEVRETTEATRLALEKIVKGKVAAALPVQHAKKPGQSQFIRYTPSTQGAGGPAQQRIIRMVDEQVDPMEPPRFKINQKIPRPPPSPPAPVLHSPPRRVTAQEQADWKIPPCISNWKNPKGYTVALDKRLAADGRGLQQVHVSENFVKLAEALNMAERSAREALEARQNVEKRIALKNKAEQEARMREMALQAQKDRLKNRNVAKEEDEEDEEVKERDAIRRDNLDNIRRERNIARTRPDKLEKLRAERDRDISEKIALGLPDVRARDGEGLFDSRLFDKSKGLDSGGIDDETYSAYDAPWRAEDNIQKIYRPTKNTSNQMEEDMERMLKTNRFVAEKGASESEKPSRNGPVQFEKHVPRDDIFGLDDLLQDGDSGRKRGGRDDDYNSKRSRR